MLKGKKGISLTTMVITVIVLLIIMGTLGYSAVDAIKVRNLNKLYTDLRQLQDAVGNYYLKYNELPVDTARTAYVVDASDTPDSLRDRKLSFVLERGNARERDNFFNPNDSNGKTEGEVAVYQFIKLDLLSNLSLNYKNDGSDGANGDNDDYLVNTRSHTVYYYKGVKVDGITYHALPLEYRYTGY